MKPFLLLLGLVGSPLAAQRIERQWRHLQETSTAYQPPDEYLRWWQNVAAECDCTPAVELLSISWHHVATTTFDCANGLRCYGYYIPSLAEAFIATADTLRESTIKHEMRHAILGGDPEHQHPSWRGDVALRLTSSGR